MGTRIVPAGTEWLNALEARQYSPGTLRRRRRELSEFDQWCAQRNVLDVESVSRAVLERFQRWLFEVRKRNGKPRAATSQYHQLCTLKLFFRWLCRQHILDLNPASELEMPKLATRLPRDVLSPAEVEHILIQPEVDEPFGLRDRAMLETLYSTGVRRAELCKLLLHDVHHEVGTLMVREGKGKKDRVVPIGERALKWIDKYVKDVRPQLLMEPDSGLLFLSATGEVLHVDYLSRLVRQYVEAGIGRKGSCHLFRHTMATTMLENGADIRFIQVMLGHAQLKTTEIYTRVSISKLKQVHSSTHPAEAEKRPPATPGAEHEGKSSSEGGAESSHPLGAQLTEQLAAEAVEEP
jgi:integrase/recombinase XerD